jgi:hypothetical protein
MLVIILLSFLLWKEIKFALLNKMENEMKVQSNISRNVNAGKLVLAAVFFLVLGNSSYAASSNSCKDSHAIKLATNYAKDAGYSYIASVNGTKGDNAKALASTLILCEDGRALGPAHSLHADIRTIGRGRFSHWGENLFFSTSDNSDPNKNGRIYTILEQK